MQSDRYRRAAVLAAAVALPALVMSPLAQADDGGPVSLPPLRLRMAADDACATASTKTAESRSWKHQALQLSRSWQLSQGAGVTVAVVDTGVGLRSPALSGRVTAEGRAGEDCVGHGTFAAGLIAGAPLGNGAVTGVAPAARVLAVRGTDERGNASAALVADGIRSAVDDGAKVVYVGQALTSGAEELTRAVAYARGKDALVVAPAAPDVVPEGPDGKPDTRARKYWPAAVPEVLSVVDYGPAGTRPQGAPAVLAPDLAAPGDSVVGIGPEGSGHFIGSGSSLAAAHVAGAAALIRSYQPALSAADVSRRLLEAAYPDGVPKLDVYAGLTAVLPTRAPAAEAEAAPAHLPPAASDEPRERSLLLGGVALVVAVLVGAAMVIVPQGKRRGWRPAVRNRPSGAGAGHV
ncbi:S8 family serine peptidase [Streptomyces sp. RP5T]|uniref:S8 family serine peptidase n=1 Tax=Streptomyces sp. RP5T TaxID=2490848 RepID=UPI000F6545B0|nr:S8 family serine peptidase [Streptomyces sp. RP5T]RRR78766.1 peptidase [Streptomyces sp. RP5T]